MTALLGGQLKDYAWPLLLSLFAGLSTSIGGLIAIIVRPSQEWLAASLGAAIGVMACVSIVELIIRNAMENDALLVAASALGGGITYYALEPLFPKVELPKPKSQEDLQGLSGLELDAEDEGGNRTSASGLSVSPTAASVAAMPLARKPSTTKSGKQGGRFNDMVDTRPVWMEPYCDGLQFTQSFSGETSVGAAERAAAEKAAAAERVKSASLMRLGMLMALTMTLHNLPEGFAVAFSAFTRIGLVMAAAIAVHNIPEGIIIAAPIYAATGSRWKAMGLATASGLSEPLGALLALLVLYPVITEERLQYMLACVGGLMLAVCIKELWPEARSCKHDKWMAWGIIGGILVMGWTLWAEVEGEDEGATLVEVGVSDDY